MGFSVNKHNEMGQVYIPSSKIQKYGLKLESKNENVTYNGYIQPSKIQKYGLKLESKNGNVTDNGHISTLKMKKYGLKPINNENMKNKTEDARGFFSKANINQIVFIATHALVIITSIAIIAMKLKSQSETNG